MEHMNSLLRAMREVCNISSDDKEDYFADEMFVSEDPNGKLDTKWRSRQTKSMDGNFVT